LEIIRYVICAVFQANQVEVYSTPIEKFSPLNVGKYDSEGLEKDIKGLRPVIVRSLYFILVRNS
jgi:hypothetical protein